VLAAFAPEYLIVLWPRETTATRAGTACTTTGRPGMGPGRRRSRSELSKGRLRYRELVRHGEESATRRRRRRHPGRLFRPIRAS
jgi:hypothetical protein